MTFLLAGAALAAVPVGWELAGDGASVEVVSDDAKHGRRSAVLAGSEPGRIGFLSQWIDTAAYAGSRVRMTVWLRSEDVVDWAGASVRVESATRDVLGFDNMQDRALRGTLGWDRYAIVVDVPADATTLVVGFQLSGTGRLWVDDVRLEKVDASVPVTDLLHRP